jgi:hypothetical protein
MVDKNIAALFARDKAKTLGVIEPLYCAFSHSSYLLTYKLKSQNG